MRARGGHQNVTGGSRQISGTGPCGETDAPARQARTIGQPPAFAASHALADGPSGSATVVVMMARLVARPAGGDSSGAQDVEPRPKPLR